MKLFDPIEKEGHMKFPQYTRFYRDYLLGNIFIIIAWLFCMIAILPKGDFLEAAIVTVIVAANFIAVIFFRRAEKRKIICVDETGISLTVKDKPEWAFRWEEIQRMAYGVSHRHKTVYLVPKETPKQNLCSICAPYPFEFHLCNTAKEALERYCPLPIEK